MESIDDYRPFTFQHGMRWKSGQWDTLGSLRRNSFSEGESVATAINPLGTVVVGASAAPDRQGDPPSPTHAMRSQMPFRFAPLTPGDPSLQDLQPLGDGSYAWALDVDAAGDAVGYSTRHQADPISRTQAAYWEFGATAAIELSNLGGRVPNVFPEGSGYANAINAAGDRVVGKSLTAELFPAGALWALNANAGGDGTRWWEVNDLNQHIPSSWYVVNAIDINHNGLIVGIAFHTIPDPANPNGPPIQVRRSVLLIPLEVKITKPYQGQTFPLCTNVLLETVVSGPVAAAVDRIEYWSGGQKVAESTDRTNWAAIWSRPPVGVRVARTPEDIRNRLPFNANCFVQDVVAKAITPYGAIESTAVMIRVVPITARMREFIETHEINDEQRGRAGHPEWPGAGSGVTIGVGYDLGMNNAEQIRRDWGPLLPPDVVDRFVAVAPYTGEAAQARLRDVRDVTIPWEAIRSVYENSTIPRFTEAMLGSFPQAENLNPNITGTLVSLVFNRGPGLQDRRGERSRLHMRQIQQALANGETNRLPSILRDMKSIWNNAPGIRNGMYNRREDEARLIESALADADGDPCN